MMEQYLKTRRTKDKVSSTGGILLTVLLHVLALFLITSKGITYLDPPPQEISFMVDFQEEEQMAEEKHGVEQDLTAASAPDPFGDVETPAPKQESELDARALFPGMAIPDSMAVARNPAPQGTDGIRTDRPNAQLEGRATKGNLARPAYTVQESGIVVVTIWVDLYGNVTKAIAGAEGTTVTDKTLWAAARNAAMETHFAKGNEDSPALQRGSITYYFNLK